jgi:CrcB protein
MKLDMLTRALLVGTGGFIGSVLRYGTVSLIHRMVPGATFPYGTLAVNVGGCLIIGFLFGLSETRQFLGEELRLFLFIGVLGGFTTFSTFGFETHSLMRNADVLRAGANILLHVAAGLAAVWLGHTLSRLG